MRLPKVAPPPSQDDVVGTLATRRVTVRDGRSMKPAPKGNYEQFNMRVPQGFRALFDETLRELSVSEGRTLSNGELIMLALAALREKMGKGKLTDALGDLTGVAPPAADRLAGRTRRLEVWATPDTDEELREMARRWKVTISGVVEDNVAYRDKTMAKASNGRA